MKPANLTRVQEQLVAADFAVAELQAMGCRVLAVYCSSNRAQARVQIVDADPLAAWLDRQGYPVALEARHNARWREGSAQFRECEVVWLLPAPAHVDVQTP